MGVNVCLASAFCQEMVMRRSSSCHSIVGGFGAFMDAMQRCSELSFVPPPCTVQKGHVSNSTRLATDVAVPTILAADAPLVVDNNTNCVSVLSWNILLPNSKVKALVTLTRYTSGISFHTWKALRLYVLVGTVRMHGGRTRCTAPAVIQCGKTLLGNTVLISSRPK